MRHSGHQCTKLIFHALLVKKHLKLLSQGRRKALGQCWLRQKPKENTFPWLLLYRGTSAWPFLIMHVIYRAISLTTLWYGLVIISHVLNCFTLFFCIFLCRLKKNVKYDVKWIVSFTSFNYLHTKISAKYISICSAREQCRSYRKGVYAHYFIC